MTDEELRSHAEAFLAEHLADDDAPFDQQWLADQGFFSRNGAWFKLVGHELTIEIDVEVFENGDNIVCVEGKRALIDAKRGEVRRLVAAFGG